MIDTGRVLQQRYRIDKQIGQGGMGAVYIATDERFGSTVAIKETLFMDDNYRKAIDREARLLNSLKHPALPRVSDHFLEENVQFLVMEYIPGEDLSHILESGVTFEVDRVLKWADQLLDALDFLHNQSMPVIHRDIKPQNLKLTSRDQIILLDFGLAKGNPTDAGHQTAAKSIFGYSRNYASLEQIQGTGTDPRSDLYSLAATLYHLLTGAPPEDALTRAMAVLSNRPDPLQTANASRAEIPRGVAGVLHKSLSLNADDRPASAAAMREMLRNHENFAHLADPVTIAVARSNTDAFAQQTKLMPSDTRQELSGQTDVKTAVMPGFVSQETSVRPTGDTGSASGKPRRSRGVAAAMALAAVLIACGSAVGLYFYDPAIFGATAPEPVVSESELKPAPLTTENAANSNTNLETVTNANVEMQTAEREPMKPGASTKSETSRATRPQPSNTVPEIDPGADVRIEGNDVFVGNVKINPDPNVPSPNVYTDKNGVKGPIPPYIGTVPFPGITKEQFDQMTPRQRQKLIDARRQLLMLERRRRLKSQPAPRRTP
jgi:serine/threonine protein kinase